MSDLIDTILTLVTTMAVITGLALWITAFAFLLEEWTRPAPKRGKRRRPDNSETVELPRVQ